MSRPKPKWPTRPDPLATSIYRVSGLQKFQCRRIYFNFCGPKDSVVTYVVDRNYPISDITKEVKSIVKDIRAGNLTSSPSPVDWEYISLFVVALEGPEKLNKGAAFELVHVDRAGKYCPNHSFFDGEDINDFDDITAAYCINYMVKKSGGPLVKKPDDNEYFIWRTYHTGEESVKFHDDSGNNIAPTGGP